MKRQSQIKLVWNASVSFISTEFVVLLPNDNNHLLPFFQKQGLHDLVLEIAPFFHWVWCILQTDRGYIHSKVTEWCNVAASGICLLAILALTGNFCKQVWEYRHRKWGRRRQYLCILTLAEACIMVLLPREFPSWTIFFPGLTHAIWVKVLVKRLHPSLRLSLKYL